MCYHNTTCWLRLQESNLSCSAWLRTGKLRPKDFVHLCKSNCKGVFVRPHLAVVSAGSQSVPELAMSTRLGDERGPFVVHAAVRRFALARPVLCDNVLHHLLMHIFPTSITHIKGAGEINTRSHYISYYYYYKNIKSGSNESHNYCWPDLADKPIPNLISAVFLLLLLFYFLRKRLSKVGEEVGLV